MKSRLSRSPGWRRTVHGGPSSVTTLCKLERIRPVHSAAEAPYNLGTDDPNQIDLISVDNPTSVIEENPVGDVPNRFILYPNPFNAGTIVSYRLKRASNVDMTIYDVKGARIRKLIRRRQNSGIHRIRWDGRNDSGLPASSGTYLVRINADGYGQTMRMQLYKICAQGGTLKR